MVGAASGFYLSYCFSNWNIATGMFPIHFDHKDWAVIYLTCILPLRSHLMPHEKQRWKWQGGVIIHWKIHVWQLIVWVCTVLQFVDVYLHLLVLLLLCWPSDQLTLEDWPLMSQRCFLTPAGRIPPLAKTPSHTDTKPASDSLTAVSWLHFHFLIYVTYCNLLVMYVSFVLYVNWLHLCAVTYKNACEARFCFLFANMKAQIPAVLNLKQIS